MIEAQRRAYLEAMGITVWQHKGSADENAVTLQCAPGSGSTLMIGRDAGDRSHRIAADIERYLGQECNWAWPDAGAQSGYGVEQLVDEKLLTRIIVFGENLAEQVFGSSTPSLVNSARVAVCGNLDEIALDAGAKKVLWAALNSADSALS